MKYIEETPRESFESSLREEGMRVSDIPVDRIREALSDYPDDAYVTVKVPSRYEVMILRVVAQELIRG